MDLFGTIIDWEEKRCYLKNSETHYHSICKIEKITNKQEKNEELKSLGYSSEKVYYACFCIILRAHFGS
jgi:hypothetical protein